MALLFVKMKLTYTELILTKEDDNNRSTLNTLRVAGCLLVLTINHNLYNNLVDNNRQRSGFEVVLPSRQTTIKDYISYNNNKAVLYNLRDSILGDL